MIRKLVGLMILGVVALVPSRALMGQEKLPTGEEVIKKCIAAIGPIEKQKALKSILIEGEFSIPQAQLDASIKMEKMEGGKGQVTVDMGQFGKQESGSDGETFWRKSQLGYEVLSGTERDQTAFQLAVSPMFTILKHFDSVECVGKKSFEGEDCYAVELKKENSKPITMYFSAKTGLEAGGIMNVTTPAGDMEVTTVNSDYRDVGGLKMSHKTVQKVAGQEIEITFSKIELNPKFDAEKFKLPAEVAKKK